MDQQIIATLISCQYLGMPVPARSRSRQTCHIGALASSKASTSGHGRFYNKEMPGTRLRSEYELGYGDDDDS